MNKLQVFLILNELAITSIDCDLIPFNELYENITYGLFGIVEIENICIELHNNGYITMIDYNITVNQKTHDLLKTDFKF